MLGRLPHGLASLGWFTAPFTAVILGQGVLRFRISDLLLAGALGFALLFSGGSGGALSPPRRMWQLLVGIGLLGTGVLVGTFLEGARGDIIILAGFAVAAAIPALLLLLMRPSPADVRRYARWFVAGVCVSVLAALLLGRRTPLGAAIGYAAHRNQLGMTIVMALPLTGLLPRSWRGPVGLLLLVGLNETGSRSALLGATVAVGLMVLAWVRRRPARILGLAVASFGLAVAAILTIGNGVEGESAVARLVGTESSEQSNVERESVIRTGLRELDADTAVLGNGYYLDPPPHNVFLETWLAGGVAGIAGLGVALSRAWRPLLQVRQRMTWPPPDSYRFAAAVAGWATVALFNNLLWAPFVWAIIGLAVWAQPARGRLGWGEQRNRSLAA